MKDLISIIVPVYNSEQYINECINSIIGQSYRNIEVILIDDGSTDRSGNICDNYSNQDNRVKVVHIENGGVSSARNLGLSLARGNWVGFVDSDDYIDEYMYEKLYLELIESNAEIAICGRYIVDDFNKKALLFAHNRKFVLDNKIAMENMLILKGIDSSVCDKLFNKKLFSNNKFPLERKVNEELCFTFRCFAKSHKIVHIGEPLYYYRSWLGSSSHSTFSIKYLDTLFAGEEMINICREEFPQLNDFAYAFYISSKLTILRKIGDDNTKKFVDLGKKLQKELRVDCYKIMKNNYLTIMQKNKAIIAMLSTKLYRVANNVAYNKLKL